MLFHSCQKSYCFVVYQLSASFMPLDTVLISFKTFSNFFNFKRQIFNTLNKGKIMQKSTWKDKLKRKERIRDDKRNSIYERLIDAKV